MGHTAVSTTYASSVTYRFGNMELKRITVILLFSTGYSIQSLLLSHLLIAGCDIGVQISVRPSVRSFVRSFVRQHLRRSLVFSTSEIAASLKPCIVIVPDIPFKHAP